jgi:hypothetical protein
VGRPAPPTKVARHQSNDVPTKQLALADVYRDATAVIDALGWDPVMVPHDDSVEVPLTRGHIGQLHERRCDLLATNLDLRQPPQRRSAQPRL